MSTLMPEFTGPIIIPEPLGVNAVAVAALGEMPTLAGTAFPILGVNVGVKAGDSTLSDFFALQMLS